MSDNNSKAPRPLAELQREYGSLCAKAGELQYKIDVQKADLALINGQLRDINFEALAAQEVEARIAKEMKDKEDAAKAAAPVVDEAKNV